MLSGSRLLHEPLLPRSSSQQLVTRKGGSTSAMMAARRSQRRQRNSTLAAARATAKPSAPANTVVSPLTSRLFRSRGQFIRSGWHNCAFNSDCLLQPRDSASLHPLLQPVHDVARNGRAFIDQAGVDLNQARAGELEDFIERLEGKVRGDFDKDGLGGRRERG